MVGNVVMKEKPICRETEDKHESKKKEKKERIRLAKQKFIGLAIIGISVLLSLYNIKTGENDCTFALVTIPLGLLLIFNKGYCFYD